MHLRGVSFKIHLSKKKPVFNDVSVTIPIGKITAITGPSGAGKTTFVELLAGMRVPKSGKVLVDGRDLRDYKLHDLRRQMVYVGQDCSLFDVSVKENLKYTAPNHGFRNSPFFASHR